MLTINIAVVADAGPVGTAIVTAAVVGAAAVAVTKIFKETAAIFGAGFLTAAVVIVIAVAITVPEAEQLLHPVAMQAAEQTVCLFLLTASFGTVALLFAALRLAAGITARIAATAVGVVFVEDLQKADLPDVRDAVRRRGGRWRSRKSGSGTLAAFRG